ncbi:hypothetical protein CPT_Maja_111 [Burkholderia phage Maja]|uniref:Uncharacterized protein n=1 Tax=Burkholderia phage Maja TaxID=2767571 RepID=A0A7S6U384_9CAUD|nr:hypothetical protein CPT_Maja_111 [Burkholderia phage Maja]
MTLEEKLGEAYKAYLVRMEQACIASDSWTYDEWCVKSMDAISIKCRHNGQQDVKKELPIELQTNRNMGRRSEWG